MQKCSHCGADLPANSRFCGQCGSIQDARATDAPTTVSNTPQPQSWVPEGGTLPAIWPSSSNYFTQGSTPAWSLNAQAPPPPPPAAENEDEHRRGVLPWSPLYDAPLGGGMSLGSGQAYTPGAPVVQGTPQVGSVPTVTGSPTPYTNVPAGPPAQGPANAAPVNHPIQGPGNTSISHPVHGPGNMPVSHPIQGPGNTPVSHPVHGPRPAPQPPEQPGTQEHHPPHGPHRHHAHHTQHKPQQVARITKVAGGSAVKTIIIAVTIGVVAAATIGSLALGVFNRPQKPILSSGPTANLTQAPTQVAPIPTTPPVVFNSGTWQGQGTYNDGRPPFDMTLMITVNGNTLSGTLTENVYSTTVNITGTISGDTISFTDTAYVSGNQIALGTTYTGTVSNGSVSGTWVFPNPQDGSGTFSLRLTS